MPISKSREPLRTYIIKSLRKNEKYTSVKFYAERFEKRTGGRVLVLTRTRPPEEMIIQEFDGDQFAGIRKIDQRNYLDQLHDEYLRTIEKATPARKKAAIEALLHARREQERLTILLEEAKFAEFKASADIIRTHGRTAVRIEGEIWDATCFHAKGKPYTRHYKRRVQPDILIDPDLLKGKK